MPFLIPTREPLTDKNKLEHFWGANKESLTPEALRQGMLLPLHQDASTLFVVS